MSTTLQEHIGRPEFAVAVRGYDRTQVDDFVGRVLEWLADWESRTAAAESRSRTMAAEVDELRKARDDLAERSGLPSQRSMSDFGERLTSVLQSAVDAAEQLRVDSAREAGERRTHVADECRRMLERASEEADKIVARAQAKERDIEQRVAELAARRAAAIADLGRLQRQLATLIDPGQTAAGQEAVPQRRPGPGTPPGPAPGAEGRNDAAAGAARHARTAESDLTVVVPTVDAVDDPAPAAAPADADRTLAARPVSSNPPRRKT